MHADVQRVSVPTRGCMFSFAAPFAKACLVAGDTCSGEIQPSDVILLLLLLLLLMIPLIIMLLTILVTSTNTNITAGIEPSKLRVLSSWTGRRKHRRRVVKHSILLYYTTLHYTVQSSQFLVRGPAAERTGAEERRPLPMGALRGDQ